MIPELLAEVVLLGTHIRFMPYPLNQAIFLQDDDKQMLPFIKLCLAGRGETLALVSPMQNKEPLPESGCCHEKAWGMS